MAETNFFFYIDENLKHQLDMISARIGKTKKDILTELLREFVEIDKSSHKVD